MSEIKFFYAPGGCSLAPHILLHEAGLSFSATAVHIDQTRSDFPAEFARINPKMRVPVLSLDENIITEVPAIATAISGLAPDLRLMGRTPLDTIRIYEWMNWLSGTLHGEGFGHLFRPQRYTDDSNAFVGIKNKATEKIAKDFEAIEGKLAGVYAVGEAFTAVDPYLLVFYRWGNQFGFGMKKYPKYTALVENLVERPAVKATLEAEDVGSTL